MPRHARLHYSVLIPHFIRCFLNEAKCKEINFKVEEYFSNIKSSFMWHKGFYVLSWQWILTGYWQLAGTWSHETAQPTALNKLEHTIWNRQWNAQRVQCWKLVEFGILHISHSAVSQCSSWISKIFPLKKEQCRYAHGMKYNNFVNKEVLYQSLINEYLIYSLLLETKQLKYFLPSWFFW